MMYSSYADMKFAYAFDSLDGEANTDSLMKLRYDTTLSFPERLQAAPWCREKDRNGICLLYWKYWSFGC